MLSAATKLLLSAAKTAQNNVAPSRPRGSSDPAAADYNHDAFMWDYFQRAIDAVDLVETVPGPVTQNWVHAIPMMQQSVLLAAVRGPDGLPKYGGGAKMLLRFYRRCILLSALDQRVLADPIEPNGGSFTGPSLDGPDDVDHWTDRMQVHVNDYLRQLDALPHHWQMHFMHAVEIVGYKHPDATTRHFWHQVYLRLVHDMHVWPETEQQLDDRLGDTRSGWLRRADPATTA